MGYFGVRFLGLMLLACIFGASMEQAWSKHGASMEQAWSKCGASVGEGGVGGVGFGWRLLSLTKIVRLWKKLSHGEKWVYFCDVKANQECFHN